DRVGVAKPESCRGEPDVQGTRFGVRHPAKQEILRRRHPDGSITVGLSEIAQHPHLRAGEIPEWNGHDGGDVTRVLLRVQIRRCPVRVPAFQGRELRRDLRMDAWSAKLGALDAPW